MLGLKKYLFAATQPTLEKLSHPTFFSQNQKKKISSDRPTILFIAIFLLIETSNFIQN